MKGLIFATVAYLAANVVQAGQPTTACPSGQHKAMIAYESTEENVISFGNVFVCTPESLDTEAGLTSIRNGLSTIHKNAIVLSIMPLSS